MEAFNQIGPWISAGVLFFIIIFFCVFYIYKLLKVRKDVVGSGNAGSGEVIISNAQKNKLVDDMVADITPVLKKRLEKAF